MHHSTRRLADVLVLESHLVARAASAAPQASAVKNGSCTVRFPSSAHESTLGGGPGMSLDEAGRILRRLERYSSAKEEGEHGESEALLCFSLSLAAFRFRMDNDTKGLPGHSCSGVDMLPFREVRQGSGCSHLASLVASDA